MMDEVAAVRACVVEVEEEEAGRLRVYNGGERQGKWARAEAGRAPRVAWSRRDGHAITPIHGGGRAAGHREEEGRGWVGSGGRREGEGCGSGEEGERRWYYSAGGWVYCSAGGWGGRGLLHLLGKVS